MTPFQRSLFLALVRNLLKLGGLAGIFTDAQVMEAAGALALLAGLAWSAFDAWRKTHPAEEGGWR